MNKSDSITSLQLILLFMTVIGFNNHVFIISPLIQTAGRDAWISVIIIFLLTFGVIPLFLYIRKKLGNESLFEWLRSHAGKSLSVFIGLIVIVYLVLLLSMSLKETIDWVKIVFMPETPSFVLTLILCLICSLLAVTSLRTINSLNYILLFFITILGFFVAFANLQVKNYKLLTPILEHGFSPVIKSLIYPASGMIELIFFLFIQHKIKTPFKFKHFAIISFILIGLTLGPLIGAITEFGVEEASKQRFPAYEEWGLVYLGHFVEHVDFLSIYQWLAGIFIRLSFLLFMTREVFTFKKRKTENIFLFILVPIVIGLTMIPISDLKFSMLVNKVFLPAMFWASFSLLLLLVVIVAWLSKRKGASKNAFE
ncbi:endospore germination permease [Neobacillus sp.]